MIEESLAAPHLTTSRLVLRPVHQQDREVLHQLFTGPGVRRFLWDDEVIPMGRTQEVIDRSGEMFEANRGGLWVAWASADPTLLAGFGGLWPFRDPPAMELLYGVAEPLWGKGYASEIARAVTTYCLGTLGMSTVRASTDVANVASIRVLERVGFRFVRRAHVGRLDTVFYELTQLHGTEPIRVNHGELAPDRIG